MKTLEKTETLHSQVERLVQYILENHPEYPNKNKGAIDTAIQIMTELKVQNKKGVIWDGTSSLANQIFGESYGTHWEYLPNSSNIRVNDKVINVGELIPATKQNAGNKLL